jgi:hypothetical protein
MQNVNKTSVMVNESIDDTGDIEYAILALSPDDSTMLKEDAHGPNKDVWIPAMLEPL